MSLLCAAPRCSAAGMHVTDCADSGCRGCLARSAADGLCLCRTHLRWLSEDITAVGALYDELALQLMAPSMSGERVAGTPGARVPNERAIDARTTIRRALTSLCRIVVATRGIHGPHEADTVSVMRYTQFLLGHTTWLAARTEAGDYAAALADLAHGDPYRIAYPTGARVFIVGACPVGDDRGPCPGSIRAVLRRTDSLLPSELVCDTDSSHIWPSADWNRMGRQIAARQDDAA